MWQDRRRYDESAHMNSLARSNSWVVGLIPAP
jgi:hypothetical protein